MHLTRKRVGMLWKVVAGWLVLCFWSSALAADENLLGPFNKLYFKGAYQQALLSLDKLPPRVLKNGKLSYLRGKCYFALADYDKALTYFREAERSSSYSFGDLYFQIAQTHYARIEIEEAKEAFQRSLSAQQKVNASMFYLAHIEQLRGKHDEALKRYSDLAKRPPEKINYPLLASLQRGELLRQQIPEKKPQEQIAFVSQTVIPAYQHVLLADNPGEPGLIAEQRIAALKELYAPHQVRPWQARAEETIGWDSNVSAQTDDARVSLAHTDSFYTKSEASGRYRYNLGTRLTTTPRLLAQLQLYSDRASPQVYENDQFLMKAGLTTALALLPDMRNEVFVDFEVSYLARDYRREHDLSFFSTTSQVTLGHKAFLLGFGPTTFKGSYLNQINYDKEFSSSTLGAGVTQEGRIKRTLVLLEAGGEYKQTKGAINDLTTYKALFAVVQPKILPSIDYDGSLSLSYLDPKNQREERGIEQLVNLLQSLSYSWHDHWQVKTSLGIIDKNSKDRVNFAYSKWLVQGGISYVF